MHVSQDRRGPCPRCRRRAAQAVEDARAKIAGGYGKLPQGEYDYLSRLSWSGEDCEPTFQAEVEVWFHADGVQFCCTAECTDCGYRVHVGGSAPAASPPIVGGKEGEG